MTTLRNDSLVRERKTERIEGGEEKRKKKKCLKLKQIWSAALQLLREMGMGTDGMAWHGSMDVKGIQGCSRVFKGVVMY